MSCPKVSDLHVMEIAISISMFFSIPAFLLTTNRDVDSWHMARFLSW